MKVIAALLIATSLHAADVPLVSCGKDVAGSTYFEIAETPTEFVVKFRETATPKASESFAFGLGYTLDVKVGNRYEVEARFPKVAGGYTPTCYVSKKDNRLGYCSTNPRGSKILLKDVTTGEDETVRYSSFEVFNESVTTETVPDWDVLKTTEHLQIQSSFHTEYGTSRRQVRIGECRSHAAPQLQDPSQKLE